jgi:YtoQ family protein
VYLSGEIQTGWWQQIIDGTRVHLPVVFASAVTDHANSDAAGDVPGAENSDFRRDHKSAKINAIRTRTLLAGCNLAVICFGEKSRQWNAAFDASHCTALGKP